MINIVLFASGSGSNVENITKYFKNYKNVSVRAIFCNKPDAYVLTRAKNLGIKSVLFNRNDFYNSSKVLDELQKNGADFVILAGFLWLIPENILKAYDGKIINIHPALLPKYGGKGMFGMNVHKAVVENCETETGITIHYVNANYDEGRHIFQAKCPVLPTDTAEDVAHKIHELEGLYFPKIISETIGAEE